jgi:CDP-glucose 4,6-dehydratase
VEGLVKVLTPEATLGEFYAGKRVFITGHTGFKGAWLALWLHSLGAIVHGYSTDPPTQPSLFESAGINRILASDVRGDLANLERLRKALVDADAGIVFHLAAQPLVLTGYRDPLGTFNANVIGTAHLLEAVRSVRTIRSVVLVTTDKVYENPEDPYPRRETDPLGGHDPYSASKAGAEIVAASYRTSFFSGEGGHPANVATVRAGNVIGGGDWAADRLIPDCVRAFGRGEAVLLRSSIAVRPWQHVLEPLSGYLLLAQHLFGANGEKFAKAWNFGPNSTEDATVIEVAEIAAGLWGDDARVERASKPLDFHEARSLRVDSSLARSELGWKPRWSLAQALEQTIAWYRASFRGKDLAAISRDQIRAYEASA